MVQSIAILSIIIVVDLLFYVTVEGLITFLSNVDELKFMFVNHWSTLDSEQSPTGMCHHISSIKVHACKTHMPLMLTATVKKAIFRIKIMIKVTDSCVF